MSPPVPLNQEISHGAAARPPLKMIHWIIFRALRPSWTSLRDKLAAAVLLTRRLKAASPDAKHPGKAGEKSEGERLLSPLDFPRLSEGQKPTNFRLPKQMADVSVFFPWPLFAKYGSRGFNPLAQVWGRGAPSVSLRCIYNIVVKA